MDAEDLECNAGNDSKAKAMRIENIEWRIHISPCECKKRQNGQIPHHTCALGSLGQAVRAAAQATHSLTCGVLDKESNEVKYMRDGD